MNGRKILPLLVAASLAGAALPGRAGTMPAPIPYHVQPFALDSGVLAAPRGAGGGPALVFRRTVSVRRAAWLRLHFGPMHLGSGSFLVLTSREDGARQILDAPSLAAWGSESAFFNGDAVEVALYASPGDAGSSVSVESVMVGDRATLSTESICGSSDDRVASSDPAVGRIVPIGCTGWIGSNGALLTAGHCAGSGLQLLEFHVPPSASDGTIRHPAPSDQYPIVGSSVVVFAGGLGNDWALFSCQRNADTGLLPVEAEQSFYRMSRDSSPATVRVTGYGVDGPAPGFGSGGPRNSDSQTEQTAAGPFNGEQVSGASTVVLRYTVDTQGGNSGSPIIADDGSLLALGIHTDGFCAAFGAPNAGTGFENDGLEAALQRFPAPTVTYVDRGHPISIEDGTVFRPYHTLAAGVGAAATGSTVSIVAGDYDEPVLTLDRAMTLSAPVGLVRVH